VCSCVCVCVRVCARVCVCVRVCACAGVTGGGGWLALCMALGDALPRPIHLVRAPHVFVPRPTSTVLSRPCAVEHAASYLAFVYDGVTILNVSANSRCMWRAFVCVPVWMRPFPPPAAPPCIHWGGRHCLRP
jgi:hypothetical protein